MARKPKPTASQKREANRERKRQEEAKRYAQASRPQVFREAKTQEDIERQMARAKPLRQQFGSAYYPGIERDIDDGLVSNIQEARIMKERRDLAGIRPSESMSEGSSGMEKFKELMMGKAGEMRQYPLSTFQEREQRRQLGQNILGQPQIGQPGEQDYQAGQPGMLQNALQNLMVQSQATPFEQSLQNPMMGQALQQQLMGALTGNVQFPDEAGMLPSPYSPQMQMGLPSGYSPQGQQSSDFSHLMQQYGPQAAEAIGNWAAQGGPQKAYDWARQNLPGYAQQAGSLVNTGLNRTILPLAQGAQDIFEGYVEPAGSGIMGALRGLTGR